MSSQYSHKEKIKDYLLKNINLLRDNWTEPEALEDYVLATWFTEKTRAENFGRNFPTYPEYLLEHIAIFWEIENSGELRSEYNVELSFELVDILNWYESGRFNGADENTIEFEAHNGVVYDFVWSENPNFPDEYEPARVWSLEILDGPHYEGDDFQYLFEAIEDLVQTIQEPELT